MRAPLTFVGEKYRKVTAVYPATDNQSCTCKLNLGHSRSLQENTYTTENKYCSEIEQANLLAQSFARPDQSCNDRRTLKLCQRMEFGKALGDKRNEQTGELETGQPKSKNF
jgi:hypothetical protein